MKISTSSPIRKTAFLGAASLALLLGGCYVIPIDHRPMAAPVASVAVAPPAPLTFTARLYPSNDQAASYGMIMAVVSNDLYGRGTFSTNIGGESFSGEATRAGNSSREGTASGAGNRGGYINCHYLMNSPTLGSGSCKLSNGAEFSMHVGN